MASIIRALRQRSVSTMDLWTPPRVRNGNSRNSSFPNLNHGLCLMFEQRLAPIATACKPRFSARDHSNILRDQRAMDCDAITHQNVRHRNEHFVTKGIEDAVRHLEAGRMIIVIDNEDRKNEDDLAMAVDMITPEAINFMATHGRGLSCLAKTGEGLDRLALAPVVQSNRALGHTAFAVSCEE
jgi:3,4-dihydroxy-2-butanone 4-phosphate synthase